MFDVFLGYPPPNIRTWIEEHAAPQPSPYFTYDSNRFITGLVQGSPNIWEEGTYIDYNDWEYAESHDGEYPEKQYSCYVFGSPNKILDDSYALGIGDNVFDNSAYAGYDTSQPPIDRTVSQVNLPNAITIGTGAFGFQQFSSINIPNVLNVGSGAFYYCYYLTNISLSNLTSIEPYTFQGCNSLSNIYISNVSSIGDYAFQGCNSLSNIYISNVSSIGEYAFDSTSLINISLPNVSNIGSYAFRGCGNLTAVSLGSNIQTIGSEAFDSLMHLTIDKYIDDVYNMGYSQWGLFPGSVIICKDGATIDIQ